MIPAIRISRTTFFAAAALVAAAAVPAHAYLFEDDWGTSQMTSSGYEWWSHNIIVTDTDTDCTVNGYFADAYQATINDSQFKTFVKTGTGTATVAAGVGSGIYNFHNLGYTDDSQSNDGAYHQYNTNLDGNGADTQIPSGDGADSFVYSTASNLENLLGWHGGEIVVSEGTLILDGYVNAWYDFGDSFNTYEASADRTDENGVANLIHGATGQMVGVSRITVNNLATLNLYMSYGSGTGSHEQMVVDGSATRFQFVRNLQAGSLGIDENANLVTGTNNAYHVNIHIEGWDENVRINTGLYSGDDADSPCYMDSSLAFGGSIGTLSGTANIYKTGAGAFTVLGSAAEFTGSLYAAGGSLVIASETNVGSGTVSFSTVSGQTARAQVSSSFGSAKSVNIAGTDAAQGRAIGQKELAHVVIDKTGDDDAKTTHFAPKKEAYFTTPEAGTLVIATNQTINNFQSYFAAGATISSGTTADAAVEAAAADESGVLAPVEDSGLSSGTSDAPIIAGTGKGSYLVIAGANYEKDADGEYSESSTLLTGTGGLVKGGVLVINQESGMGGVYQGSIVGARVKIYNKTTFAELEKDAETSETSADKEAARLSETEIRAALTAKYGDDSAYETLNVSDDGSFALDTEVALDLVEYFRENTDGTNAYYVEYTADSSVKGGTLVVTGAGDLALLLEDSNYSGIYLDSNRTGKTVFNISTLNTIPGAGLTLGNSSGEVSFVVNDSDTFDVKLTGFGEGSSLKFAISDTIESVGGSVVVGNSRESVVGFSFAQEDVLGTVYVESGVTLNFQAEESVFPNARAIVICVGETNAGISSPAAAGVIVSGNQNINNLTGDSSARLNIENGSVLTINSSSSETDAYSGLAHGTYNGSIFGNGSIVKGGAKTLTIGGGVNTGNLTGTVEIGEGALVVSAAGSLSGVSSLILNEGTSATMTGDQALRTLYGAGTLSVSGTLTLGAAIAPETNSDRFFVATNLGAATDALHTATSSSGANAFASFSRFVGNYDKEGNVVLTDDTLPTAATYSTQAAATTAYLTATGKLAYSGFEASALSSFVGQKIGEDTNEAALYFTEDNYKAIVAAAESGTWDDTKTISVTIDGTTVSVEKNTLLTGLGDLYQALSLKKTYEDAFSDGAGGYSAYGTGTADNNTLRSLFISVYGTIAGRNAFSSFVSGLTSSGLDLYNALVEKYEELVTLGEENNFSKTMTAAEAKSLFSKFFSVKNPGGSSLFTESDYAEFLETAVTDGINFSDLTAADVAALQKKYSELVDAAAVIAAKGKFAGIEITGAFANDVTTGGALLSNEWAEDIAFSGDITAGNFIKTGGNTITLTGTLSTGTLVVSGGVLKIESSTLASTLSGGITVDYGTTLVVNAASGVDSTFSQTVSGRGNFIKTGSGKLTLGDDVKYSGTTEIEGGTLQLSLRNLEYTDSGVAILPQGSITFTGSDTTLVLAQGDDEDDPVTWNSTISSATDVAGVSIEKTGAATLTISGDVSLGEAATLTVSGGTLNLTGEVSLGADSAISIASGAALSVSSVSADDQSVTFSGSGALRVAGTVAFVGANDFDVSANGDGGAFTAFTGAVTLNSGATLSLSGDSVFPYAREVFVASTATLSVGSDQSLRALSGTGTVSIASGATLDIARFGDRLETDYSTGFYAFNEEILLSAPNFSGTVSGDGTLDIGGSGAAQFSGTVSSNVSVSGGQLILSAENFSGSVTVSKSSTVVDSDGNRVIATEGEAVVYNVSTSDVEVVETAPTLSFVPRTVKVVTVAGTETTVDVSGKTISADADGNCVFTDDDGVVRTIVEVVEWDYVSSDGTEYAVNWGVKDADGEFVSSLTSDVIAWNSDSGAYELNANYTLDFKQLSETEDGKLVISSGTTTAASEVIFTVENGVEESLDSSQISFEENSGGKFGKAGSGTLSVAASSLENCETITVYKGTLSLSDWVDTTKIIVEDATLSVALTATSETPNFTTILGSGIFELTAANGATISIGGDEEGTSGKLPTYSSDGKFFNGVYSFKSGDGEEYSVNITGTTPTGSQTDASVAFPAINTDSGVALTLTNATILQTQNTEIAGTLIIAGEKGLKILGEKSSSGNVLSSDLRRMVVSGTITTSINLVAENVGFGFSSSQEDLTVAISSESVSNAFFIESNSDGDGRVGDGTKIYSMERPLSQTGALKNFSIIKTGTGVVTYDLDEVFPATVSSADYFGINNSVYLALSTNDGIFNLGVDEGSLKLQNLPTSGSITAYNGLVNVNLVALRSATEAAAGTLVFETASTTSTTSGVSLFDATDSTDSTAATLAETVRGGGNVIFNQKDLTVSAAQKYLGQTLISADTTLSGDGRSLASSFVQVAKNASLSGGVVLAARNVAYSVTAARGETDTGLAGETTLTITLDDARLGSDLKCALTISEDGTAVKESSLQELGNGVEGVSIDSASYDSESGVLTLSVTDKAYAKEGSETIGSATGDSYEIKIDLSTAIPSAANASKTSSGTTSVAGDFQLDSGGSLSLDAAAGDKVDVGSGTIVLNGATIVENLNDSVRGKTLTLFNASSISRVSGSSSYTGTSAVVNSLSEGNDDLSTAGESTMKLLVYTDSATGAICARMITDNFSEVSAGYNDAASGSFLDALSAAARNGRSASARILINGDSVSGDARTLLFALNGLTTDQLGEEVTKLSPAAFGSMLAMPLAAFNSDISRLHARLDQRRYDGADPLRESNEYEFFALAQSDFAENDDASDTPTFDYNLYGATAGFDWKPDYSTTLGVAVGYTYGKAKIHHDGGKINMDDMRITAFASHLFGNSYIEYGLQGGIGSFDIKRNTIAGKTSGDADSYFGGAFITVGSIYTIYNDVKTGEGLYFTPNFGLSGFYEKIDAFKESGAGGLDMDSSDGTGLRARLAAGIQWATPVGELMSARFGAEIAYSHEFLADELDMDGRFSAISGTKFSATANAAASDVFSFSPTIDLLISEKTSVYLGYGIEFSTDSGISQNVNAGFRHRF